MISLQCHKFLKNTSIENFLGIYDGRESRTNRKEIIEEVSGSWAGWLGFGLSDSC